MPNLDEAPVMLTTKTIERDSLLYLFDMKTRRPKVITLDDLVSALSDLQKPTTKTTKKVADELKSVVKKTTKKGGK